MNGIDISRWQKGIDLSKVPCDFVIIKATQGTGYTSPEFKNQIQQARSLGKKIGVYHYAGGGGVINEANHFLDVVKGYVGQAILVLDWEGQDNENFNNANYAMSWLEYVKEKTGITPFIYMSKSVCRQYKWDASYPLWCAQYKNYAVTGYQDKPWTDSKGFGAWTGCKIFQYSSSGRLPGYPNNLDLDLAYITAEEWDAYAQGTTVSPDVRPTLKKGDHNDYVRAWQTLLKSEGYNEVGDIDGWFGDKTEKAVVHYQQDHGMESGIIGEQTWNTIK